jgi:hypothetical protein
MPAVEDRTGELCLKLETLSAKVALLKDCLAKQRCSAKLEHYWELEKIRSSFREFKWRIEQLEGEDDSELGRHRQIIEATWTELVVTIDFLLAVLPEKNVTRSNQLAHPMPREASQSFQLQS